MLDSPVIEVVMGLTFVFLVHSLCATALVWTERGQVHSFQDLAGVSGPDPVTAVLVHELLRLRYPAHGRLFKTVLAAHIPGWRSMDAARIQKRQASSKSSPKGRGLPR